MSYGLKYNWKVGEDYPQWADIPEYLDTISKGYLLDGETPKKAYKRVCKTVAERLGMPYLASKFFKYIWDGWLCLASPVLSNTGTERGLPISCFGNMVDDSLHDIAYKNLETMMLAKNGGGVGTNISKIRPAGSPIKNNGSSDGVVPFMKMYDSSIQATNQGCYDDQTYVLTNKGWKLFRELDGNELVANVTEDKKINFVNFTDYIEYEVDEELVKFFSSTGLDLLVTKNHNMAYESKHRPGNRPDLPKTWNEKLKLKTAEEFNPKNWNGFVGTGYKEKGREITWEDKFKIAYQADGKKAIYETLDGQKHVTFRLKKQRKIERLRVILSSNNISYKESVQVDDSINFYCYDVPGSLICQTLSWIDLNEFSSIGASQIIEELGHWDGSFTKSGITYSSVERENVDIVQALCVIAQKRSKIRTTIRKPPRQVLYSIHISRDKRYCNQSTHKTYQHYSGKVYCITVPDSRIVIKRGLDGTAVVCGNSARRGAGVFYFDIMHGDFDEIIEVREPKGDVNRQCLNTHLGCTIPEGFMEKVIAGDKECRRRWVKLLQKRKMTGEPYILFLDNANRDRPQSYINNHLFISMSNLCCLHGDTFVSTKNGPRKIKDLVGEKVTIWDGNEWVDNDGFELKGEGELYRIHLKNGEYIDCTENHRHFIHKNYNSIRSNKIEEFKTNELESGWFLEYHKQESHGDVDLDSAYIKGFLIGDGTSYKGKPMLNLYFTKYECENMLIESLKETSIDDNLRSDVFIDPGFSDERDYSGFKGTYGCQKRKIMRGLTARKSLIKYCTDYKYKLPEGWIFWNRRSKLKFLSGLFDADGTSGKTVQISSINEQFIVELLKFINSMGYDANIDVCTRKGYKDLYRITLSTWDSMKFVKESCMVRLKCDREMPNRRLTGWRKIVKIEKLEGSHKVYCTTVPSTGKFALTNGIMTGNSEITLYSDTYNTFVCCLSSLNMAKYDEWKDSDLIKYANYFLDGVMEEFIQSAKSKKGFKYAARTAEKGRAVGLGVLGWHSYLQQKGIPFDSLAATLLTKSIFKNIREESDKASQSLAKKFGEPDWCEGTGYRNTHRLAIAPTTTNAKLAGGVSQSIEPWSANVFTEQTFKGTFIRKNKQLEKVLEELGENKQEVWDEILSNGGSVASLEFLDDYCYLDEKIRKKEELTENELMRVYEIKDVFKTFREIDQMKIVSQAAERQKFIDQSQSLNLAFHFNSSPKEFNQIHLEAWKKGIKTLYYVRTESSLNGATPSQRKTDCEWCEG